MEQGAGIGHTSRSRQGTESESFLFFLIKTNDLKQETARDWWVFCSYPKVNPFSNLPTNFQTQLCILGSNPCLLASLPAETSPQICTPDSYLPISQAEPHVVLQLLEAAPVYSPRMVSTEPATMPTRLTASPRAQTTVSVSSDMGAGISGSEKKEAHRVKGHCMPGVIRGPVCVFGNAQDI